MKVTRSSVRGPASLRQAGLTLIETLVSLSIFALVVGGALALFGSASASQNTTQFTSDLSALRAATKALYFGQGTYGTGSLGEVLINGRKVPSTMTVSGAAPSRQINHSLNGSVTVTGATSQFTLSASNIPTEICIGLASMGGWDSVKVGGQPVRIPPVTPTQASTDCSTGGTVQTLVFTGS
jgi:prepilin-type N-terminal cleavage/methylation domain-containing protein